MKHFYIISNRQKDAGLATATAIRDYLEQKGASCVLTEDEGNGPADLADTRYTDPKNVPEKTEGILVIGGDGTLLHAARDLMNLHLPLLGINMGTLGFLAEVEFRQVYPALDRLLDDQFSIEERMMICGGVCRRGDVFMTDYALNDIVITRNGRLKVIDFNVYVDGAFLSSFTADGVIVSTPTGSTGYNLSVGGPIVAPEASLMLLSPIAPHTLNSRPIVLPDTARIMIEIGNARGPVCDSVEVSFDGDTSVKLQAGDTVNIRNFGETTRLIKMNHTSFLEVLRNKMKR